MKKDRVLLSAIVAIAIALVTIFIIEKENASVIAECIATITAVIAAVILLYEYRRDKKLNEAQFLLELNDQFIGNPDMTDVEHALECYYFFYEEAKGQMPEEDRKDPEKLAALAESIDLPNLDLDIRHKDRQKVINYLVHLEGIAAIVRQGVINVESMDDLLAYRFFIAVNNPKIQAIELKGFQQYYQGIFELYDEWSELWEKESSGKKYKRSIPLMDFELKKIKITEE